MRSPRRGFESFLRPTRGAAHTRLRREVQIYYRTESAQADFYVIKTLPPVIPTSHMV